jgi:hypothetical protein
LTFHKATVEFHYRVQETGAAPKSLPDVQFLRLIFAAFITTKA